MKSNLSAGCIFRPAAPIAISLGLLALMVSGPFLLSLHTAPISSFWNEWWAGALGLAAAVSALLAQRNRLLPKSLPLSQLLLIPAVLLVALLLQLVLGRLVFTHLGLLYAIYLLWAGLLLILGRYLAETIGLARLVDVLALAIVLGALIGALVALVQWLGISDHVPWIFPIHGGTVRANLGQANHHAHYSWLGITSAFYLRGRGTISRGLLWLLVLLIAFGSVITGSRSVFLYLLVLLAALAWARHRDPQGPAAALVADAALLLPVLVALNFFGAWVSPRVPEFWAWLVGTLPSPDIDGNTIQGSNTAMPAVLLYESATVPSTRLAEMHTAWLAFVEQPWLGQGAGNFRWASFMVSDEQFMITEHAHNFVFQLLAEFGAPATIAVMVLLVLWARRFLAQPWRLEHFWCAAVLGIGAVHSLLEYPLWYSYFLGPTALLLGATDSGKTLALAGRRVTLYLALAALAGAVILGSLRSDYSKLEIASRYPSARHPEQELAWQSSLDSLIKLQAESLLSPWVLDLFFNLAEPSRQSAEDRADLCERVIRFRPERPMVTRCAMQLAIAGRDADAQKLTLTVLRAYPAKRAATAYELKRGAQAFPEIEPLLVLSQTQ